MTYQNISVVLPAKNEAGTIGNVLNGLRTLLPGAELIVVDDGSTDDTADCASGVNTRVITHPYSKGNGAAIKTGVHAAKGDIVVFMDADGQHDPAQVSCLLKKFSEGYDLVIGARSGVGSQSSLARWGANKIYNMLASWLVGRAILDLTSGMRAVRRSLFIRILHLLPNGFSYPTTSTMAFYRAGYSVAFVPITVTARTKDSKSHIRLFRDGGRFLLIIFKVATLYSPLKVFVPLSAFFLMTGSLYFTYTKLTTGHFTNFGGVLFITSVLIFLIGLVSEQITSLVYSSTNQENGAKPKE
jgi:glycosyltransferase involved in cell wall biosynthesis